MKKEILLILNKVSYVIYHTLIFFGVMGGLRYFFADSQGVLLGSIFLAIITLSKIMKGFGFEV
jgi:hypothetical protein